MVMMMMMMTMTMAATTTTTMTMITKMVMMFIISNFKTTNPAYIVKTIALKCSLSMWT